RSGLLDGVVDGVSMPKCLAIEDIAHDETWLWFEELHNDTPHPWSTETWVEIARQFGRWQGEYLVGKPLPSHEWLCRGWLERCFVEYGPPGLADESHRPLIARLYPGDSLQQVEHFWAHRDTYLAAYRRAPHAVAHLDADRRNLFLRGGRLVAIDWALASIEPAGADLCALIVGAVYAKEVRGEDYNDFDRAVFHGYLAGLADVGWHGDPATIRLMFLISACLRLSTVLASTARMLAEKPADPFWDVMATLLGTEDRDETIRQWARGNQFLAERAEEARRLV
ncbi:hypothetical protein HOK31_20130, partial [Candidatus Poribacteria bacterium]|nr:hypothetical protein [Candidatus Poribacteria bacterium]